MRIRFERGGVVLEYERKPMKEGRLRTLCSLAAAGIYAGMISAVAALCGLPGVVAVGFGTILCIVIVSEM